MIITTPVNAVNQFYGVMRYLLLFSALALPIMSQANTAYEEETLFTYHFEDASLQKILTSIQDDSDFNIFYSSADVNDVIIGKFDCDNATVNAVLDMCLNKTALDYEINDKTIIIHPKKEEAPRRVLIEGAVQDSEGNPMPFVSISIVGSIQGAISDINGKYSLETMSSNTLLLRATSVGFTPQEVLVNNRTSIDFVLAKSSVNMDEVVVTGFQEIDRREFTGSVERIKMADIKQEGGVSIDNMLQGQVAGVQIENVSGTTGARSKIRIRGNSSISGNREPLWVVDGVVMEDAVSINPNELYSGDPSTLVSSAIGGINPNDIEEISILKDASATALYGTQAVNGVIVITTKRGKKDQFNIDYSGNVSVQIKPQIENFYMMNSEERISLSEELYQKDLLNYSNLDFYAGGFGTSLKNYYNKSITEEEFYEQLHYLKGVNTDWFDLLFKNSVKTEHNLSISSGTEKAQYFFSVNYFKDLGSTIGQETDRLIGNFKANYNLTDKLRFGAKMNLSSKNQDIFNTNANPYTYALNTSRAIPEKNMDGSDYYYTSNMSSMNIFNEIENSFAKISNLDAQFQFDLDWQILPSLRASSLVAYRKTESHIERIYTEESNQANVYRDNYYYYFIDITDDERPEDGETILPRGGLLQTNNTRSTFVTFRNSLNWSKVFGGHKVDLFGGQEYRSKIYEYDHTFGYGYEYNRGKTASPSYLPIQQAVTESGSSYYGLNSSPTYTLSYFGTASYTFKGKYTLNSNMRTDGSNQFGETQRNRFLPIWSVGANWNLTKESFMQDQSLFDNLALRGSYGLRGNVSGSFSPQVLAYYGLSYAMDETDKEEVLYVLDPPNPDLKWEKEHIYNLAVDFSIKQRIRGSIEYYNRSNFDLISPYPVSYVSGFKEVNLNWASMRNQGVEITLNTTNIQSKNFQWTSNLTFGYNRNEVLDASYDPTLLSLTSTSEYVTPVVGKPMSGLYAFKFAHLDNEGLPMFYNSQDEVVYGMDLSERDLDALEYIGSREPVWSGGLSNSFRYKDFNFSFLFVYSGGNKIRLDDMYSYYYNDVTNVSKEMANRWLLPGDEQYTNVPAILDLETQYDLQIQGYDTPYMYNRSNIRTVSAAYLKLKSINLGYTLKEAKHGINGVGNLDFLVQAQNLWTLAHKDLNGRDPEAITEGINMPLQSTFTFGVKAAF